LRGVQQIQLRTEGRENGDLGAVAVVPLNLQMSETHILLGCYRYIFHRTGNSAQLCKNFGISGGEYITDCVVHVAD
jgi:hypothetical protein